MADSTRTRSAGETKLLERARQRLPGGVLGTSRYADEAAFVVKRGQGSKIYDVSGREYIDYVLASGPLILGHAHPAVVAAVRTQIEGGSTFFMVNEPIIELAEEICRAMPCAEQVRFTSTGSEATFFALRVARTARQRDKILKFEGGYHGAHDYSMMSATPRSPKAFPAPVPDSSGIPHALEAEVLIAPYNDLATVEGIVATHADELAAVIIEPFQRLIPPQPGFLQGLREITRRHGILLVFDEVVTGFRLAYGGAQHYYGVVPDIACIGKIVGGGFPLAAVCASEELMRPFDPQQDGKGDFISQSGTLNGNPIAAAAGLDNGGLLWVPKARRLFFDLLLENYAILRSAAVPLGKVGPFHPDTVQRILRHRIVANAFAWAFYPTLRKAYCSMSGDLPRGRTEIDNYNLHLISLAGGQGCPLNRRVYDVVKRMERERIPPAVHMLDVL